MKVLIIDDDENKVNHILRVINDFTLKKIDLQTASDVAEAIEKVTDQHFDLMLLDLNLPIRKNEAPRRDGGVKVLKELRRNPNLIKPSHVIGLTGVDDLRKTHQPFFDQEGWVLLELNGVNFQWEEAIQNKLTDIHFQKNQNLRQKILFLSANPLDGNRLRLDEEFKRIDNGLRGSKERDSLILIPKFAIDFDTASQAILDNKPFIVHFSGHGNTEGLAFEDETGNSSIIVADALYRLFKINRDSVKCVVLNACESKNLAKKISKLEMYAIGNKKEISDETAVAFSVGFYKGIGGAKAVELAFQLGLAHVSALNNGEARILELWKDGKRIPE